MLRQSLILVALLVLVSQCSGAKPSFCRDYDCPGYTVQSKNEDYELRCYNTYKWVTTNEKGWIFKSSKAFMRLFHYISGSNDRKEKINMTVPVIMAEKHSYKSSHQETMSFFIPYSHQASPPAPTDSKVRVESLPAFCVYVRSFPGWINFFTEWWAHLRLKKALEKNGLGDSYNKDYYYMAGYNSPMDFWKRHNEIWFIKK